MSRVPLRAPREHGQILAVPAISEVGDLLRRNRDLLSTYAEAAIGKTYAQVRASARQEVLALCEGYHREAGEDCPADMSDLWFVAGHQPELFHPGVWFKNFALSALAREHGAMPLNLVVDTDLAKPSLLHIPADGKLVRIPYDASTLETPYEERQVHEEALFADLPNRVRPSAESWGFQPMLGDYWREVLKHSTRTRLMGERFAAARRAIERRWHVTQRELPMSRICQTGAFSWFVSWILQDLPRFHAIYNETIREYRLANGIRSRNHPVPDLGIDGDWMETPFWCWRRGASRRGRLFARMASGKIHLRSGPEPIAVLGAGDESGLLALEALGVKVRSRALTTTFFVRLFLADLFLHGIGGGIYDALTDRIVERFTGMQPPEFLVVSATLLLPLPRYPDAMRETRCLGQRLRDLAYKPELFANRTPQVEAWIAAKKMWIARDGTTHDDRVARFHAIRTLNVQMSRLLAVDRMNTQRQLTESTRHVAIDAIASRRDYSFCLFPERMLQEFFQKMSLRRPAE